MTKYLVIKILNKIQKILITISNYYKFFKQHTFPHKTLSVNAFASKTRNLPSCYEKFKEEELEKCYDHFKKHFYNSVFLESTQLKEYSLKEALLFENKNSNNFYLEFGVGGGNSINLFADILKTQNLTIYGFDSFVGLKEDWKGHVFYPKGSLSKNNQLPGVRENVKILKGWIQDTLPIFLDKEKPKINFMHIDVDTYETTKYIFQKTKEFLTPNCVIVLDDMYNFSGWSVGEYKALREEFKENEYKFIAFSINKGNASLKLTK